MFLLTFVNFVHHNTLGWMHGYFAIFENFEKFRNSFRQVFRSDVSHISNVPE